MICLVAHVIHRRLNGNPGLPGGTASHVRRDLQGTRYLSTPPAFFRVRITFYQRGKRRVGAHFPNCHLGVPFFEVTSSPFWQAVNGNPTHHLRGGCPTSKKGPTPSCQKGGEVAPAPQRKSSTWPSPPGAAGQVPRKVDPGITPLFFRGLLGLVGLHHFTGIAPGICE